MKPSWSVMIPTYNPTPAYLKQTLQSVLVQDPGEAEMQIELVDDQSTDTNIHQLVSDIAGNRAKVFVQQTNRGLAGNWNTCIERARGHFIHILHQDDLVHPGFYVALQDGFMNSDAGAAFCRNGYIDQRGIVTGVTGLQQSYAGLLPNWLTRIASHDPLQCVSIAVRKDVYQSVGFFLTHLKYVVDWEMWVRIASKYSMWYEPQVLADYRDHSGSETARLRSDASTMREAFQTIPLMCSHLPPEQARVVARDAYANVAHDALTTASKRLGKNNRRSALSHIALAVRYCHEPWILREAFQTLFGLL